MKVSELGEFGLIERLAEVLAAQRVSGDDRLVLGIGDDAAVWRNDASAALTTTDTLVAGVHFHTDRTPWRDIGWKAIAVNVSDIAAMGGTPELALVTLALPEDSEVEHVEELYRGIAEAGAEYGVAIAGGDIVRSPTFAVTAALTGRAGLDGNGEPLVMRRDAAKAGDLVAVTGHLGGAAGGLAMLLEGREGGDAARAASSLLDRHLRPQARPEAGRAALEAGIRCGIDVSDGLLQDLGHVCRASHLGAVVWQDKLPVDPALNELFTPEEAVRYAVSGGEDYELVLVGSREHVEEAGRGMEEGVTIIGEMVMEAENRATLLDESGRKVEMPTKGWDHLRGQP